MSAPSGLSTREVRARRDAGLANGTPDDAGRSFLRILSTHLFTMFNGIVGGSFVLLLILGAWQDALFGFSVVANTVIGVVQEFRAQRTLSRLAVVNTPRALVLRDGAEVECAVADVVLDDLLVLRPGEQLTGDAVVVACRGLEVDQSLLTGEADPVSARMGGELLSGSTVAAGSGLARVVGVGPRSYAARITAEARQFSLVKSELRRAIGRIIRWLSIALVPIAAIVVNGQIHAAGGWGVALSSGAWRLAAVTSVASIIALVPAGLVFMTSLALALGAVKLAQRGVLVGELAAVEGLARVDMLCIDKTGTLTESGVTLDRVEPLDGAARGWQLALAALAADPVVNATSRAIGARFSSTADACVPDASVSFSSRYKWSAVQFSDPRSPGTWVLGGADVVLPVGAGEHAGARTLVLAHSAERLATGTDTGTDTPRLPAALTGAAVLVFREKVRVGAAETLRFFEQQGVEVCVLSGDDPRTVAAVAHDVGLLPSQGGVDARTLPSDPVALATALRTQRLFGRVTPEQKRAMVIAFRSLGRTVAMVGDGVNDTLALKHADLGIAMGSGSAAARAVAHLVLLESDLSRLPSVVAEGRQVIANVERVAKLFLTKTVYAIALAVTFGLLLWTFPFLPRQLSVIDGLTIGLPALVLALIPNSRIHRLGFLRRAARFCVPAGLILAAAVVAVVVIAVVGVGSGSVSAPEEQLRTVAVVTLTLSALWVLVILARPFTRLTASVVAGAYAGLIALVLVPFARDFLQLQLPDRPLLLSAIGVSAIACVLLEAAHRIIRE